MNRRLFVKQTTLTATGLILSKFAIAGKEKGEFAIVRVPEDRRKFKSHAVESLIAEIKTKIGNKEIAWMFENCFPNTLDTTVDFTVMDNKPDTYVITGDIDAMWLRDSSAQVYPYLPLCNEDKGLHQLIKGVIYRQTKCILKDPYANAFYKDETKTSEWKSDDTKMQPGIHERKWEIDSLCYPIRLAYKFWKETADIAPFDNEWLIAMKLIVRTFNEQQRMHDKGQYSFMRETKYATDTVPLGGYGYPVYPNGLICSMFRPSDDATIFPYLIPSNLFAKHSLAQLAEMVSAIHADKDFVLAIENMRKQIAKGLETSAIVSIEKYGKIYAFEVNGNGSCNLMDDANIPSLLSLGYLIPEMKDDEVYKTTCKFVLSKDNPFFFKGAAAEGVGGPHAGMNQIWHLGIIIRGMVSTDKNEIKKCLKMLQNTHAGTGFMHESFNKDDASKFTRPWFAWANTLFGEFIWKTYREKPELLK